MSLLANICDYESDSEESLRMDVEPQPAAQEPSRLSLSSRPIARAVACSPSCKFPPIGAGDTHPARLSLFPRIQMIPVCDVSPPASAGPASITYTVQAPSPPWVTSNATELHQPSPRRARLEKMRSLRPERGIRICRKETSSVVSAASSGGISDSRPSSPEQTRSCIDLMSPPPSSTSSVTTITCAPPLVPISTSIVHPRFRRYHSEEQRNAKSIRDPYVSDSSDGGYKFRTYTPDHFSSPDEPIPTLCAARWLTINRTASSSSERFPSPLSDLSSSPPRTPSPPASMAPLYPPGSEYDSGEDELIDDDDEYPTQPRAPSLPPQRKVRKQPRSRTVGPSPTVLSSLDAGWAECRWNGCGEKFRRNFAPMRQAYAPFNHMHYEVLDHFRRAHGLDFLSLKKEPCQWEGCFKAMTGKSFHRHLLDAHMHIDAHRCEGCGVSFSRRDAVTRHRRRCEGKVGGVTALPGGGHPRVDKNGSPWEQPLPGETDAAAKFADQIVRYTPRASPGSRATGESKASRRASSEEPLAQVVKRELPNKSAFMVFR